MLAPLFLSTSLALSSPSTGTSDALRATVTLGGPCKAACPGGALAIGAGEIVGRRDDGTLVVLTARHIVQDARSLWVFLRNGAWPGISLDFYSLIGSGRRAQLIAYSSNVDLALVAFTPEYADDYTLAPLEEKSGENSPGVIVGDPYGSLWTISHYRFLKKKATTFEFDCKTCGPGDSGGGVFGADGRLLGIVTRQKLEGDERTSEFEAISLAELRLFLRIAGATKADSMAQPRKVGGPWARYDAMRTF